MKWVALLALAAGLPLLGGAVDDASTNVNTRYIVEGVNVSGSESRTIGKTLSRRSIR